MVDTRPPGSAQLQELAMHISIMARTPAERAKVGLKGYGSDIESGGVVEGQGTYVRRFDSARFARYEKLLGRPFSFDYYEGAHVTICGPTNQVAPSVVTLTEPFALRACAGKVAFAGVSCAPCQGRLARCGDTRIHCPVNGL